MSRTVKKLNKKSHHSAKQLFNEITQISRNSFAYDSSIIYIIANLDQQH